MEESARKKEATLKEVGTSVHFIYSEAWKYSKTYVLLIPVYILTTVLSPVSLIFIPTIAVYFITGQGSLEMFAIYLSVLFAIYMITTAVSQYLRSKIKWSSTFVRIKRLFNLVNSKCMTCDYKYYEDEKAKEEKEKAASTLWSNWQGAELILKQVPAIGIDVLGLIIFISSSSLISYKVVLILLAMVIVNFSLGVFCARVYDSKLDKKTKIDNTIEYIYKTSKNEMQGKDIRNYKLASLFNNIMNKQITIYRKYTVIQRGVYILPNLSDSIFGFIRDIVAYTILVTGVANQTISVTEFTLMIGVINGLSTYLSELSSKIDDLLTASKDVMWLINFLNQPSDFNTGKGIDISKLSRPLSIEFKDVTFKYSGSDKATINHLSFIIHPGEKMALVGENGAGKTTIIKLLSGFYKPDSGLILINGHSINDYNILDYYSLLSVINQDINVIGLSIKEVIACAENDKDIDDKRLNKSIYEAVLTDKISSLKNKDGTYLTQNLDPDGVLLSGGETQKFMLARALYKNGDVLMLDEPTSALDPIAEGELYAKYNTLTANKTSLFISHRLSSTRFCDNILYLKDGAILEQGTHEELMQKKGEYYKVFNVQAHYYKEDKTHEETI